MTIRLYLDEDVDVALAAASKAGGKVEIRDYVEFTPAQR